MKDEIQVWLTKAVAAAVKADVSDIDPEIPFDRFGLDSVAAVDMTKDLSTWLGREFSPTLLYDYPTITLLSEHLAQEVGDAADARKVTTQSA